MYSPTETASSDRHRRTYEPTPSTGHYSVGKKKKFINILQQKAGSVVAYNKATVNHVRIA